LKIKKVDLVFFILIVILTIISIDFLLNESHRVAIENISKYEPFQNLYHALFITFIVCVIGNLLPVPTPYTIVVCFSSLPFLNLNPFIPLLVGFIASLGCLVGELGGYMVGRGAAEIISEERIEKLKKFQLYLVEHPKVAPFMIFIFGLTPLNDDLITVPLGILKYSLKKTIFWCWLGKLGLMLTFAYNAFGLLDSLIPGGMCGIIGGENWILSVVSLYLIVITIYLIVKIDFGKIAIKFIKKNKSEIKE